LIVDAHTHLLPDRLARKIRAFFGEHQTSAFAYELDHTAVLDRHHADGITAVWNLPYAHKADIASGLNDAMLEISTALATHPVEVIAGCTVHPGDADPCCSPVCVRRPPRRRSRRSSGGNARRLVQPASARR
jgi:hypothetical protein